MCKEALPWFLAATKKEFINFKHYITTMTPRSHKAGFVSIIGKPNVGKSTLMNTLLGEKLAITTHKAQTTRHRIAGILNGDNFQIIYADTPGIINPNYALQQFMMRTVRGAMSDADVLLWVVDIRDQDVPDDLTQQFARQDAPVLLLLNKSDLLDEEALKKALKYWATYTLAKVILPISALQAYNTECALQHVVECLPEHPPYYPQDTFTDKPERFFAAEIIREKILRNYQQEIPYSVEVVIDTFKREKDVLKISAIIHTERKSQKGILIGDKGHALKQVGIAARHDLEAFFGKKVYLRQHVKIVPNWRTKPGLLHQFGYV